MTTETRSWKDWRDRSTWDVLLYGEGPSDNGGSPEGDLPAAGTNGRPSGDGSEDGAGSQDGDAAGDRIVFRGRIGGMKISIATAYPGPKPLAELTDYELQWYLDEALTGYLRPQEG